MNFTNYDFGGTEEREFDIPSFEEVMRNRKSLGRLYIIEHVDIKNILFHTVEDLCNEEGNAGLKKALVARREMFFIQVMIFED